MNRNKSQRPLFSASSEGYSTRVFPGAPNLEGGLEGALGLGEGLQRKLRVAEVEESASVPRPQRQCCPEADDTLLVEAPAAAASICLPVLAIMHILLLCLVFSDSAHSEQA